MKVDWIVGWISESEFKKKGGTINRYRDNNELIYCLRSIYKYVPWINKIHIILGGNSEIPTWLNPNHAKINIVKEPSLYNPVQPNSETKKMFYHLIPGLADYFFTSDDDMFLVNPVQLPWYFHNNKIVMNSIGFCIKHRKEPNDGSGHIPVLWNKHLYDMAIKQINISTFLTMGRKRCNPWIIMKKYLLQKNLILNGNLKGPLLWVNNADNLNTTYNTLIFNMLFRRPSSNNFICINDDFSITNNEKYKEQYIVTQRFLTFLFINKAPWETMGSNLKYTIGSRLLEIKINIAPCHEVSKKIPLYFKIQDNIQYNIVPCENRFQKGFNYCIINNKLTISRKDKKRGWNFSHTIVLIFSQKK